jgi:hypothetical protein
MDHQALLFGGAARPGQRPGEARRAAFGLVGASGQGAWTNAWTSMSTVSGSVQFHSTLLQLGSEGRSRFWKSGDGGAAGLAGGEG